MAHSLVLLKFHSSLPLVGAAAMDELMSRPISDLSKLIQRKEISPVDLTREALDRIDRFDDTLKAFISRYDDDATAQAQHAEQEIQKGHYRGRLHGIPIGVKDNIYLSGKVTTMGSKIHKDYLPTHNAGVVDKLAEAGAVTLGKSNMHEYALGATTDNPYFGTCRNPWDLDKTPGGSSGGSAAAVASGMALAALGSDTSGSIRIPASVCGIVGLKPTYGRVSKYGVYPEAWTLDHVGPITGTVVDAAIMLDAISGYDAHDQSSLSIPPTKTFDSLTTDVRNLVIGVDEEFFFADVDDDIAAVVTAALDDLRSLGATLKKVKLSSLRNCIWALTIIDTSETTTVHDATLKSRPEDYGDDVRFLLECGALPSAVDYLQAQQLRRIIQMEFDQVFGQVDTLVAPTMPIRAPGVGETTSRINGKIVDTLESLIRLVGPANLAGLPALSVPCGLLDDLPVGMQLIGRPCGEQEILNLGAALESTDPLKGLRPRAYLTQ